MNRAGKPSIADVLEMTMHVEEFYGERNRRFQEDERFYELEILQDLDLPDELKQYGIVLPTGRDMVDAYTNHIDLNNARISVNRFGTSPLSKKHQENLRKFYYGLLYMTNVMSPISPWRVAGKHHGLHGVAVIKSVWDGERWPGMPERKEEESENDYAERVDEWRSSSHDSLPIQIQAVNPHNIYPDPAYGGELYIIEKHDRLVVDVKSQFPRWSNPKNSKITEYAKYVSYWSTKHRVTLIDGEPVGKVKDVTPHTYGFIPYTIIDAGLGNIGIEGKPEQRYVGIIRYIFDLLKSESRDYSIADTILAKTAWPWGTIEGDDVNAMSAIKPSFGTYVPIPKGTKVTDMYPQVPPEALNRHLERTAGYIAAHAAPRASQGLSESGVRSSSDRRLVLGEAALRYQYSSEQFKFGGARVFMKCARIFINVVPGPMSVWAKTPYDEFDIGFDIELKKDDIKAPFTCHVEFAPFSEEDEYRRHDDLERMVASGIITKRWARTQMSNIDPNAMEIEEEIERLKADPQLQQQKSMLAAQMMQMALAKRGVAMAVNANPAPLSPDGGQPAQPGMPRPLTQPVPNMPIPGSAEEMQKTLQGMRSQTPKSATQGRGGGGS